MVNYIFSEKNKKFILNLLNHLNRKSIIDAILNLLLLKKTENNYNNELISLILDKFNLDDIEV